MRGNTSRFIFCCIRKAIPSIRFSVYFCQAKRYPEINTNASKVKEKEIDLDDLDILLPKKDIVTGDFLQEVEDINLDFKKKDILSDIPSLDDVDLPSIKKKKTKTDIWG